jgi:hypothetical protein
MLVGTANYTPARAVGEHIRRSLEDITVDVLDLFAVASGDEPEEDFLGEILGVAKARRPSLEKAIERAAIALG